MQAELYAGLGQRPRLGGVDFHGSEFVVGSGLQHLAAGQNAE